MFEDTYYSLSKNHARANLPLPGMIRVNKRRRLDCLVRRPNPEATEIETTGNYHIRKAAKKLFFFSFPASKRGWGGLKEGPLRKKNF